MLAFVPFEEISITLNLASLVRGTPKPQNCAIRLGKKMEGVREIDHPPEDLVESSPAVILAGFLILASVLILAAFNWAARGRGEDGRPDVFGKMVTVHQVSARYQTSWSPGRFWPSKESHGFSKDEGEHKGNDARAHLPTRPSLQRPRGTRTTYAALAPLTWSETMVL